MFDTKAGSLAYDTLYNPTLFSDTSVGTVTYAVKGSNLNTYIEKTEDYVLSKRIWNTIRQQMKNAKKTMPTDFGQPPRNITAH